MYSDFEIYPIHNGNYIVASVTTGEQFTTNIVNGNLIALIDEQNKNILQTELGCNIKNILIACKHVNGNLYNVFLKQK